MNDFIFGTFSTDELRRKYSLGLRKGVTHYHRRVPRDPRPGEPVVLEMSAGPGQHGDKGWVYWTTDGSEPDGSQGRASNGSAAPMEMVNVSWDVELWGYIRHFKAILPGRPEDTVVRYLLSLDGGEEGEIFADHGQVSAYYVADDPSPAWTADAIIYHVFMDRFNPGHGRKWKKTGTLGGFYGGTIRGVTEKLDYIQQVGFNTLWLSPIFPSPSHHGYDATDLFNTEPRLGTMADFQDLMVACKARGLRVILDFVPNHISNLHPIFQAAIRDPKSPTKDWFTFTDWPEKYNCFFDVKELPQLNLSHPAARQHMIDAALYWLHMGVDGFRLDYAVGPAQEFWADFRRQTRRANPECWTFGEVVDPPYEQISFEGLLDGTLDFMLLEGIRQTIAFKTWTVPQFASFLDRHEAYFPAGFSRPSFLDNHDMNRFRWAVEGDKRKLKLAALCQFTLIGPPIVYYGTEVGLSQERDVRQGTRGIPEEARQPMIWDDRQDKGLLDFYTQLLELRKKSHALRIGKRTTIYMDDQVLVYSRSQGEDTLFVVLNIGASERVYQLPYNRMTVVFNAGHVEVNRQEKGNSIILSGWSGAVLK